MGCCDTTLNYIGIITSLLPIVNRLKGSSGIGLLFWKILDHVDIIRLKGIQFRVGILGWDETLAAVKADCGLRFSR